jgi:hypothetical protein
MVIQVHDYSERDGLSVCEKCGFVRRAEDAGKPRWCPGAPPKIKTRNGSADPNPSTAHWRVVDSYSTGGGVHDSWRAVGPWRATREEAEADAEHGSMRGALRAAGDIDL